MTATLARPATRHPASDGAHRLAWWLAAGATAFEYLAYHHGISFELIDRLLSGEVEPSDDVAETIARVTEGAVRPDDWAHGGPLGWLDKPFDRDRMQEVPCR